MLHALQQQMLAQAAQHSTQRLTAIATAAAMHNDGDTLQHIVQHYLHLFTAQQQTALQQLLQIVLTEGADTTTAH
jgi:hypothetical protein